MLTTQHCNGSFVSLALRAARRIHEVVIVTISNKIIQSSVNESGSWRPDGRQVRVVLRAGKVASNTHYSEMLQPGELHRMFIVKAIVMTFVVL